MAGLSVPSAVASQLTVSWSDNSDNESGFKIERSLNGSSFSQIAVVGTNVESYDDQGLEPSTTYWYRVRAYNSMGNSSFSNVASGTTAISSNTAPTITSILDQIINQDTTTGALSFSVGDAESSPFGLSTTASSSNTSLVPNGNIVFNGVGTNRTVTVTPEGFQNGSSTITVTVSDGSLATDETFVVTVNGTSGNAPVLTISGLESGTTVSNDGVVLTAAPSGDTSNLARVEFYADGVKIGEATEPPYTFTWSDAPIGEHSIVAISVNNNGSTGTSSAFNISVAAASRLISLSTRGMVDSANPMINGFAINGTGTHRVLLRAVGEGLERLGVSGVVGQPVISVVPKGATIALAQSSGGWDSGADADALLEAMNATGAFAIEPGSSDAALFVDLNAGQYTAVVSDASGVGGICLVEAYLVESSNSGKMVSLSTRGYAGTGNNALIGGLTVSGTTPKRFLIRGIGPGLSRIGVNGVIEDPQISVVPAGGQTAIAANDEWSTDSATTAEIVDVSARIHAFSLTEGSSDAVLLVELDPGIYTVVLSPASGQAGTALIEAYDITP